MAIHYKNECMPHDLEPSIRRIIHDGGLVNPSTGQTVTWLPAVHEAVYVL